MTLNYPDNFNFGYDVVDEYAAVSPDKRAMVWCNVENEEHIFTFLDVKRYSNKMANVFREYGIGRGDRVMLVLKRHYEYWFAAVALHKLGAVMIPATHMLTVDDFVYRINASEVKAIVCTAQDDVPSTIKTGTQKIRKNPVLWCVQKDVEGFFNLTSQMETAGDAFDRVETSVADPMMLYFTSGTTGYPKGVIHDFTYPLAHIVTAKYWQQAQDDGLHFTVAEDVHNGHEGKDEEQHHSQTGYDVEYSVSFSHQNRMDGDGHNHGPAVAHGLVIDPAVTPSISCTEES